MGKTNILVKCHNHKMLAPPSAGWIGEGRSNGQELYISCSCVDVDDQNFMNID